MRIAVVSDVHGNLTALEAVINDPRAARSARAGVCRGEFRRAGMTYDGDPRASYVVIADGQPTIRRVAYDIEREVQALAARNDPHRDWMTAILRSGRYTSPSTRGG